MTEAYPGHRPVRDGECGYLLGGDNPGICRRPRGHYFPDQGGTPCESDGKGLPSQRTDLAEQLVYPGLPESSTQTVNVISPAGSDRVEVTTVQLGLSPYILMTVESVDAGGKPVFHVEFGGGLDVASAQDVIRALADSLAADAPDGGEHDQPDNQGDPQTRHTGAAGSAG